MCAPEAPVVGAPEETSVNAPMAVATTFAQEEAQLSLPKAPKLEEAAMSVSREGGATDRSTNAVDIHFYLDRLAMAVRGKRSRERACRQPPC